MPPNQKSVAFKPVTASRAPRRAVAVKKVKPIPDTVCVSCMPMGETQIIAMLMVAVFGLAGVLTTAVATLQQQQKQLDAQRTFISSLEIPTR